MAIVVKGLDNPFFEQINKGCQKWNAENEGKGYTCLYTGPASSADEVGEVQIVEGPPQPARRRRHRHLAVQRALMAKLLREKAPSIPVMTIDADLSADDAALRKTYLGTDNYLMGVKFAEHLKVLKPDGGTICLQLGNVAAANINQRAAGTRDTLAGAKGVERLSGEGGWTEIDGCPGVPNDQADLATPADGRHLHGAPGPHRLHAVGRLAQFAPQAYAQVTDQVMAKLKDKSLVIVAGDTLPPQMEALKAAVATSGRPAAVRDGLSRAHRDDRPDRRQDRRTDHLHRPRRVHPGERRQLHRRLIGTVRTLRPP